MPDVLAIFGPTGSGKTALAVALARRLRGRGENPVAVSADALQVYEGLPVLTGVASPEEQDVLPHRLTGFVPITESFSAGEFAQRAHDEIDALLDDGARPIVVGGTGLYLRAALTELTLRPPAPPEIRERWSDELERSGPAALHRELSTRAPWAAADVAPTDAHRLIRLLELSDLGELTPRAGANELWTGQTRHPTRLIGVVRDRDDLARRIDARVDAMIAAGVAEEVAGADAAGASPTARKALGFEQLLSGDVEAMKTRTRQYARRQLTWMRKLAGVELVDLTGREADDVAAELLP